MDIENKILNESDQNILNDPKRYRKMMLIIEQALYDLGYHESAKMLENQSGVPYFTNQLLEIKSYLKQNNFQRAIKVVQSLYENNTNEEKSQNNTPNHNHSKPEHKNNQNIIKLKQSTLTQVKNMINQTFCMFKILNQQFDSAMKIISDDIDSEAKKQFLCEALVLGNQNLKYFDLERKKNEIFNFCLSEYQEIGQKEIQKVIESYSQEGQYNKDLKGLFTPHKRSPPMKILTMQFSFEIKHTITHLKLNPINNQVIVIEQNKQIQQIHLLQLNKKNYQYQRQMHQSSNISFKLKYPILSHTFSKTISFIYKTKLQSIESLTIDQSSQRGLIGLASFNIIQVFNSKLQQLFRVQSPNKIEKFLHIGFHPISELLYSCGYFETMGVMDATGQQVMSIYPYPKTRKFEFHQNEIIGISLVTNKVYKHSLDQQVLVGERQLDDGVMPMDLSICEENKKIGVSSLQFLYLLNIETLQILGKITSPNNPNKTIIQIKFYNSFLITLCKNFNAYQIQQSKNGQNNTQATLKKRKEWSGDGTFDIVQNIMISGLKQLMIWQQGDLESQMQKQSELNEERPEPQVQEGLQNLEEFSNISDSEIDSESIEEEEDDSMVEEEDQDVQM